MAHFRSVIAATTALVMLVTWAGPASADDHEGSDASIAAFNAVAPSADVIPLVDGAQGIGGDGTTTDTSVPASGSGLVLIEVMGGKLAIGLPDDVAGARVSLDSEGTAAYEARGDGADVVVQATDSGVRIATVIPGPDAPRSYAYDLPQGAIAQSTSDGGADVVVSSGGISVVIAHVGAPWATDAAGHKVPTRFDTSGGLLVQVVDHDASFAYPVVADPIIQADCGYVTCTVRYDRAATKNIRDLSGINALAATFLSTVLIVLKVTLIPGLVVAVVATWLGANAIVAGRYYGNGNCFGIKMSKQVPLPVTWTPTEVKYNTYNCR